MGPLHWPVGPFQLSFSLAQTSSHATGSHCATATTQTNYLEKIG